MNQDGVSLIELLVVIAIIGILTSIGFVNLDNYRAILRIREAQTQFSQDLEKTRQLSRRLSVNLTVKVNATTNVYEMYALKADGTKDTSLPSIGPFSLPVGIQFSSVPSLDSTFRGPFGRIKSATAPCYGLKISNRNLIAEITLLGVTGIVVSRPVKNSAVSCA
jgi:prepilin-type N-terminal cleavage/methylation domain-containing protein